jgi:hypothetical protein
MDDHISRRRFLIGSTLATSTLLARGAAAAASHEMQSNTNPVPGAPADAVSIAVSERVSHEMLSGVGASWHSIVFPTVGHGGSGFGGTPPVIARHERLWESIERHADWLGLKFIRAEMDWRQWQPEKGRFTWDSPEMAILERILSWAQRRGSDVMLQCMWPNVEWLAFPEYRRDPALVQASAPCDLGALAEGWVTLLRELIGRRGHSCIRWIHLVNEPNFYWWLLPPDSGADQDRRRQTQYLAEALRTVGEAVRAAGIPVRIVGPGWTDLPVIPSLADEPWWPHVDDVDFHCYGACFDWEDPRAMPASWAYRMGERLAETLPKYRQETGAKGRGLLVTEFGSQIYGWKADDPAPGSFKSSLKDTEFLIRAMNMGVDAANHWSFTNRGDMDGQWQYLETWDRTWKQWLDEAVPHRDSYYVLGLATRHVPHRARILETEVRGGVAQGCQRVWAAAMRSPRDSGVTLLVVNDAERPWPVRLSMPGPATLVRLSSTAGARPDAVLRHEPVAMAGSAAELTLEPFSLTVLTDSPLGADGPGRS